MNCDSIKKLAVKYEKEEINFIEKKIFENHLKKCDRCRNEYKLLLGLVFILKYSNKTYKPSLIEKIISVNLIKFTKITILTSALVLSIYQINQIILKEEKKANKIEKIEKEEFNFSTKAMLIEEERKNINKNSTSANSLKIISRENEKETEIFINKELEIKARLEN